MLKLSRIVHQFLKRFFLQGFDDKQHIQDPCPLCIVKINGVNVPCSVFIMRSLYYRFLSHSCLMRTDFNTTFLCDSEPALVHLGIGFNYISAGSCGSPCSPRFYIFHTYVYTSSAAAAAGFRGPPADLLVFLNSK